MTMFFIGVKILIILKVYFLHSTLKKFYPVHADLHNKNNPNICYRFHRTCTL